MKNKDIQEQRMKGYFIQATKEIIKAEGLKAVSVRSVAEKAGYSYTTMYHYFKDIKELLFYCVKDFQQEIEEFVSGKRDGEKDAVTQLHTVSHAWVDYFVQYPGIFELFYLELLSDLSQKRETLDILVGSFDEAISKDWERLKNENTIKEEKYTQLKQQLKFVLTGCLLFYLNRHTPHSYQDFKKSISWQLDLLI